MKHNTSQLSIAPGSGTKKLSAGQRKFNGLIKKIEKQRQVLQAWEASVPLYMERWSTEFRPQLDSYHEGNLEFLYLLDACSGQVKLSKADRKTLSQEICALAISLMEDDSETLKALYTKHSGRDFEADRHEEDQLLKQGLHEIYGFDLGDDTDLNSPEAIAQKLHEQFQAEHAKHQQKPQKKTARQLREEKEAHQTSQSVREIYRKLASTLHPDRESDPVERERKTALMQRVNHAYSERNLLELLQLQLEVEHIDTDTINTLSTEKLKHYNQVLTEQLGKLEQETLSLELAFKEQFDLDPFDLVTPENLLDEYQHQLNRLIIDTHDLKQLSQALQTDPKALKAWLKEQREYQKAMTLNLEGDLFDYLPDEFFR